MAARAPAREPRIPLAVVDAPTQRFYAAALFGGAQVWKFSRIAAVHMWGAPAPVWEPTTLSRALLLDFALVYAVWWLAIPTGGAPTPASSGVAPGVQARAPRRALTTLDYVLAFFALAVVDVVVLGRDTHLGPVASSALTTALAPVLSMVGLDPAVHLGLGGHRVRERDVVRPWTHLTGQHTVHLLPHGTARLAPERVCQCVDATAPVALPVVFHHLEPALLEYSVTDVERGTKRMLTVKAPKTRALLRDAVAYAPDADDAPDVPPHARGLSLQERKRLRAAARERAQRTDDGETVHELRLTQPGLVRLERVLDKNRNEAQLVDAPDVLLVACPAASFVHTTPSDYCPNDDGALAVRVAGVAPLELTYTHVARDGAAPTTHTLSRLAGDARGDDEPPRRIAAALAALDAAPGADALAFAQRSTLDLPLALDLGAPGVQTYALTHVRDACGSARAVHDVAEVRVHARASVHFDARACTGKPRKLLRDGRGVDLPLVLTAADAPWSVEVQYTPRDAAHAPWTRRVPVSDGAVHVTEPGTYTLAALHGAHCAGTIGAPWTCEVEDVPPPRADIHFESIEDACAGTIGVKALSVLEGEPPFRLLYEVQRQGEAPRRQVRVVEHQTRDQLEFWPSTEGLVTYRFLALDDANYAHVPLDGPTFTQVVHPLADAAFTATRDAKDAVARSCGRAQTDAEVALTGHGPWELTYSVRQANGAPAEHRTVAINASRYTLHVDLPQDVVRSDARATISLERLRDGKGCERRLATRDLRVDVSHTRPTVGFLPGSAEAARAFTVRDGAPARLPVRLTGDAPWHLMYAYRPTPEAPSEVHSATLHHANDVLTVYGPGTYTLQTLRDAHCDGDVLEPQHTFEVAVRPRPRAAFAPAAGHLAANGSALRAPVCVGVADAAPLALHGYAPVSVRYLHQAPQRAREAHTFATSETTPPLPLRTDVAGWHTYEITDVGDALYASAGISAGAGAQRLEQMVYPRAHARFASTKVRTAFCVGDTLQGALPRVELAGTPPFTLRMTLRPDAASAVPAHDARAAYTFTRRIDDTHYTPQLDAEAFVFGASGTWTLALDEVRDATGCAASLADQPALRLDVVETAGIAPASTRTDYCVGEQIDYVLQGMPPWTVHYTFNGRERRATSKTPEFARTADEPGTLVVHSAAHQQNQCRSTRAATTAHIHALPSARVSSGRHRVESLHRGHEATITFTLTGEPPFAFTYQRTEPVDTVARPRVLETHTVERVEGHTYTLHTTQEGTWSVVWLQDRWCQVSLGEASGPAAWDAARRIKP
ncbi:hypothetical protein CBS9595_003500 [Malassezia furfur]|nr:hypothetical protein CBS9595_003500 [Malassezia furfur]